MTHALFSATLWTIAGWTMLHAIWIGTAIGCFAWIIRRYVQSASATTRYAIALACLAILAISPLPIAVYVYQAQVSAEPAQIESPISIALPSESISQMSEPNDSEIDPVPMMSDKISSPASISLSPKDVSTTAIADDGGDEPTRPAMSKLAPLVAWLPWLWLIGTPTTLLFLATGLLGAERLRRQSHPIEDAQTHELLRRLAALLHIRARIAIGMCDRFAGPILVGIIRPMILLPPAALLHWSPEQLEMVLLHELSHIRRRDNLVNLLQRLVEALMFFVPSVWFISAWVRLEREHCCDRCVVKNTGKARAYAATLVELAERRRNFRAKTETLSKLLVSPMAEHQLLTRVRQILKHEEESMKISRMLFGSVLTLVVAIGLSIGWYGIASSAAHDTNAESPDRTEAGSVRDDRTDIEAAIHAGSDFLVAQNKKTSDPDAPKTEKPGEKKDSTPASGPTIQPADGYTKLEAPPAEWLAQWQAANVQRRLLAAANSNWKRPKEYLFTIRFLEDVKLSSPRAGVLDRIKVQQGDAVKAGDELAGFDSNEAEQAKLALKIAQIKLDAVMQKHKQAAALQAGAIPKGQLDQLALDMKVATLEMQGQDLKLASLVKPFRTPISGVVAEVLKQAGEAVAAGDPILRIVNVDRFAVEGTIDIARTPVPKRGDAFRFVVQIGPPGDTADLRIFEGKIDFVSSQLAGLDGVPRASDTQLKVRGVIDNRDGILRAGMKGLFQLLDEKSEQKRRLESKAADKDAEPIGWVPVMFGVNFVNELSRDGDKSAQLQDNQTSKLFEGTPFRGGLEMDFVDPNGPAGKAGIRDGDILVGLGKWETSTFANAVYVLRDSKINPREPLKFYILRKKEVLFGHLNFDPDYVDKGSWHEWLKTRTRGDGDRR